MNMYQKFKKLHIDHSAIGLDQRDTQVTYYCTPEEAEIIGWAGVDGIHYCTNLEENTVFATAIGVIGGADGPTAGVVGAHTPKLHAACSSLHFEAVGEVELRAVISEKLMEDVEVQLI